MLDNIYIVLRVVAVLAIFLLNGLMVRSNKFGASIAPKTRFLNSRRTFLDMKWIFAKGMGNYRDLGGVGSQGEYYYIPSKKPTLQAPKSVLGPERTIPLFPRNQVLAPLGEEYIGVYEMRYRQLFNDLGERGVFGHIYFSQENQKLSLVGTLARVKRIERLDDGGMYVTMEGMGRFFIKDIMKEKPYLKARVQVINDFSENDILLESLEQKVLEQVRYSVKIMKLLYPQNNYTMSDIVMQYRPALKSRQVRVVSLQNSTAELERRAKFSFSIMDMLKTDPVTKLLFLQDYKTEQRFKTILKVLEDSTSFLEGELRKRGVVTDESLKLLRNELLSDTYDLDTPPPANWIPQNYIDGEWKQMPVYMD